MMGRADEIIREAAIVQRSLKRSEINFILSAQFDKAQEMSAMREGLRRVLTEVTAILEHAEARAA